MRFSLFLAALIGLAWPAFAAQDHTMDTTITTTTGPTLAGLQLEDIARIAHEANRTYCAVLGDHSQPTWENAPEWQRTSAVNGVKFHLANPDASPSASHDNWLAEKLASGWKYGPQKDPEKREHPCCVPFSELPPEQQTKDRLFSAIVRACVPPESVNAGVELQCRPNAEDMPQSAA